MKENRHEEAVVRPIKGWKDIVRLGAGGVLLLLGLAGLFLPLLQGILMSALGVFLLAPYIPFFARIRDRMYARFPKTEEFVLRVKRRWLHMKGDR